MPSAAMRFRSVRSRQHRQALRASSWSTATPVVATVLLAAVLLGAALLGGCATVTRPVGPTAPASPAQPHVFVPPSGPSPTAAGPSTSAPPEPSLPPAALLADLVPAPAGSHPWSFYAPSVTGVLTLSQFIQTLFGTASAADRQADSNTEAARGFQYSVRRNWEALDGSKADVYLIKFTSITGAASFFVGHQGADTTAFGAADSFSVPTAGNAAGFEVTRLDSAGDASVEMLSQRGDVAVLIEFFTPATPDRAGATALMERQYAKLPDEVGQPDASIGG